MSHFNWQNSVEQHALGSGNMLYGIQDHQLPVIYFQVIFNYSAIFDPEEETGRAYMLTHMLLKGNRKFPRTELYQALDQIGGTLNLYATADHITVTGKSPREQFGKLVEILKRVLDDTPDFSEEELEIARSRARDHLLTLKDNYGQMANYIFLAKHFQKQYYGKILSGTEKSLDRITLDALNKGFWALKESGMTIALAGDYCKQDIERLKPLMSGTQIVSIPKPKMITHQPKGLELYYYHRPQLTQTYTVMGQQGIQAGDEEIYGMILFNKYFGADFTSILSQEIREKNGWSYYVQSDISLYRHAALFSMEYAPNTDVTVESFIYLKNLFQKHLTEIPSAEDLQFPIQKYMNSLMFKFSTTLKRLSVLVESLIYHYPDNFFDVIGEKFELLSPTTLNRILNKKISSQNQIVTMVGNIEPLLPEFKAQKIFTKMEPVNDQLDLKL